MTGHRGREEEKRKERKEMLDTVTLLDQMKILNKKEQSDEIISFRNSRQTDKRLLERHQSYTIYLTYSIKNLRYIFHSTM